jgi:hypothetical protein
MAHPTAAYHLGWPARRDGHLVLEQERLVVADQHGGPIEDERPEEHLGPRQQLSDEGLRITHWTLTVKDGAAFVDRRRRSCVPA